MARRPTCRRTKGGYLTVPGADLFRAPHPALVRTFCLPLSKSGRFASASDPWPGGGPIFRAGSPRLPGFALRAYRQLALVLIVQPAGRVPLASVSESPDEYSLISLWRRVPRCISAAVRSSADQARARTNARDDAGRRSQERNLARRPAERTDTASSTEVSPSAADRQSAGARPDRRAHMAGEDNCGSGGGPVSPASGSRDGRQHDQRIRRVRIRFRGCIRGASPTPGPATITRVER